MIKTFSFSADEMALLYSLLGVSELGKSLLKFTYGKISDKAIEDKLSAASHSLLARRSVDIVEGNKVEVTAIVRQVVLPVTSFVKILQLAINQKDEIEVINIYIHMDGYFTSQQVKIGVVHELNSGEIQYLPAFIVEKLQMNDSMPERMPSEIILKMSEFPAMQNQNNKGKVQLLLNVGMEKDLAETFAIDISKPLVKGSLTSIPATPSTIKQHNMNETGPGFLFFIGDKNNWLISFKEGTKNALGQIKQSSISMIHNEISELVV